MNSPILERYSTEKNRSTIHSIEFFVVSAVVVSVLGILFFAAV